MGAPAQGFYGSNSVMVRQPLILGPQTVTWILDGPEGAPRNGEEVIATNKPVLSEVSADIKWLALPFRFKLLRGALAKFDFNGSIMTDHRSLGSKKWLAHRCWQLMAPILMSLPKSSGHLGPPQGNAHVCVFRRPRKQQGPANPASDRI